MPVTFLFISLSLFPHWRGILENVSCNRLCEPLLLVARVDCQRKRIPPTKVNIFAQYVIRVRSNIHLVICMSPIGSAFRDRLRMFPSLVNCCTIGELAISGHAKRKPLEMIKHG